MSDIGKISHIIRNTGDIETLDIGDIADDDNNVTYSLLDDQIDFDGIGYYGALTTEQLTFVPSGDGRYLEAVEATISKILTNQSEDPYSVLFTDVTNINFSNTDENSNGTYDAGEGTGRIIFGQRDFVFGGDAAQTITTDPDPDHARWLGDIWINTDSDVWDFGVSGGVYSAGSAAHMALMHEVGHSLGLKHPFFGGPSQINNQKYTIMADGDDRILEGMKDPTNSGGSVFPKGLQLYDIAALQSEYGRDYGGSRGVGGENENTTYSKANAFSSSGTNGAFIYTIWDGGGNDTISAEGFAEKALIDLRQGEFSSIGKAVDTSFDGDGSGGFFESGQAKDNVAIAFYTVIENAIGTAQDDILIGNAWDNRLESGAGNDTLYGDGFVYDLNVGFGALASEDDPFRSYGLRDGIHGAANDGSGDDTLIGGIGADIAFGGFGNDTFLSTGFINGLDGDLYHGGGINILSEFDDGTDIVDYSQAVWGINVDATDPDNMTVQALGGASPDTAFGATDTLVSIEKIIGNADLSNIVHVGSVGTVFVDGLNNRVNTIDGFFENFNTVIGGGADQIFNTTSAGALTGLLIDGGGGNDTATGFATSAIDGTGVFIKADGATPEAGKTIAVNVENFSSGYYIVEDMGNKFFGNVDVSYKDLAGNITTSLFRNITGDSGTDSFSNIDTLRGTDNGDTINLSQLVSLDVPRPKVFTGDGNDTVQGGFFRSYIYGGGHDTLDTTGESGGFSAGGIITLPLGITEDQVSFSGVNLVITSESIDGNGEVFARRYKGDLEVSVGDGSITVTNAVFYNWNFDPASTQIGIANVSVLLATADGSIDISPDVDISGNSISFPDIGKDIHIVSAVGGTYDGTWDADNVDLSNYTFDHFNAYDGDDVIDGDGRDNTINGGMGNDTINGRGGNDTLNGGNGIDTINGGADNDIIRGDSGNDILSGGNGIDTISGGFGDDTINGDGGGDNLSGGSGKDTINGGEGADTIRGNGGNDTLDGGDGNDFMEGDGGDDIITGGAGDDTMFGDAGSDTYIVSASDGNDTIIDFGGSSDTVQIGGGLTLGDLSFTQTGNNLFVSIDANNSINISNQFSGNPAFIVETISFDNGTEFELPNPFMQTNQPPIAVGDEFFVGNTDILIGNVLSNDSDPDGDVLQVDAFALITANGGTVVMQLSGDFTYTPAAGFVGVDSFDYVLRDLPAEDTDTATVTINVADLVGTDGDDVLTGGADDELIVGLGGNDIINGAGGNDTLIGGTGMNTLSGGAGDDSYILSGMSFSSIFDDEGTNNIVLSDVNFADFKFAATSEGQLGLFDGNTIVAVINDDDIASFSTISFADVFNVAISDFIIFGSPFGDFINLQASPDSVITFTLGGGDFVIGSSFDDFIHGGDGFDNLLGMGGDDVLNGGDGGDILAGFAGNDALIGGSGEDSATYLDAPGGIVVDLAAGTATDDGYGDTDILSDIENVTGSEHNDVITGNDDRNGLDGWDGDDQIFGLGGDDVIRGGFGNDILDGGDGNDNLGDRDGGDDQLIGGNGNDFLTGGVGQDTFDGGAGTDTFAAGFSTQSGIEIDLSTETISDDGNGFTETITGVENVNGTEFADIITGSDGDNDLFGFGGNDIINGGSGNDAIDGFGGDDLLMGGLGDDTYTVFPGEGDDVITDIGGFDTIILGGGLEFADMTLTQTGADLVITGSSSITITDMFAGDNTNTIENLEFSSGPVTSFDLTTLQTPEAEDDSFTTDEDTPFQGNIFADNGFGADSGLLRVTESNIVTALGVSVLISPDGSFAYIPDENFHGQDSFTYTLTDGTLSDTATVFIDVLPVNDAPVAEDDGFSGDRDQQITGNVLDNDADIEDDELSVVETTIITAEGGTVAMNSTTGDFTYTPEAGFVGTDSFDYTVTDGDLTDTGTATLTVNALDGDVVDDGTDLLTGTNKSDNLFGLDGNDTIFGNNGKDFIGGGSGNDELDGGNGKDILYGNSGNDRLIGGNAKDELYGGSGDDLMWGGAGDDIMNGGAGNDRVEGEHGDDILAGGAGDDVLVGGKGSDIFVFEENGGVDRAEDFDVDEGDIIDMRGIISEFDPLTDDIAAFVRVRDDGADSILAVDKDGAANGENFETVATLSDTAGELDDLNALIDQGNLVVGL